MDNEFIFPRKIQMKDERQVDIKSLRPGNSYADLFKNRDYVVQKIILDNGGNIPSEWTVKRACPNCNTTQHKLFLEKDSFTIVKCLNCHLVYVNPTLKSEKYIEIYKNINYGHIIESLSISSHEYRRSRFGTERIELIEKYARKKSGRLLEIGSGSGFFLEEAKSRGWDVSGCELSEPAYEFSRSRGINVLNLTLHEAGFANDEFDVVTAFDVLEHIYDPKNFIREVKRILKPNGILFLYVPNLDSASFHLMGEGAHFIWPTHHLTYFTPETLSSFLKTLEFQLVFLETKGLDFEDYIWQLKNIKNIDTQEFEKISDFMQFYINASGFGKNLRVIGKNIKS
jgi:2-polyprenyl-3-methyl-5-hydroxy-6-metoxy-1,4-benzoquinol methylase